MSTTPEAEAYMSKMLDKQTPYEVEMFGCTFKICNVNIYPPGKITAMFASYLLDNNLIQDKTIADIGVGCFGLGIIAAKNGARAVIGVDIEKKAVDCARANVRHNMVESNAIVFEGNSLEPLLPEYIGKVDVLISGAPWDTLSSNDFNALPEHRKILSRSFYDVDNDLIAGILSRGPLLLSPDGRIFITSCKRTMPRIEKLCFTYKMDHQIVRQEDIHQDGNIHYIIEIIPRTE